MRINQSLLVVGGTTAALYLIGVAMDSRHTAARADAGPAVTIAGPLPVPVSVTGTPNVVVTNSTTGPVITQDVNNPPHHPYTATCTNSIAAGTSTMVSCNPAPGPPSGAQLVIQDVSLSAYSGLGVSGPAFNVFNFSATFNYTAGGNPASIFLPTIQPFSNGIVANQLVVLYPDVNTSFTCLASVPAPIASGINCTVSGYYTVAP